MKIEQLKSLIIEMEGNWSSHRTYYLLENKQIKTDHLNINIKLIKQQKNQLEEYKSYIPHYICSYSSLMHRKIKYSYIIKAINNSYISGLIQKQYNNIWQKYSFTFFNNCLKISLKSDDIQYIEYMYFINSKLHISIILIKYNSSYTGISFHSNIKIQKKS